MERFIRWARRGLALAVLAPMAVTGQALAQTPLPPPEVLDPDLAVRPTVSGLAQPTSMAFIGRDDFLDDLLPLDGPSLLLAGLRGPPRDGRRVLGPRADGYEPGNEAAARRNAPGHDASGSKGSGCAPVRSSSSVIRIGRIGLKAETTVSAATVWRAQHAKS